MINSSLTKLKSLARFLKISNVSNFQNWNIELFANFLEQEPELAAIIGNIKSKYKHFEKEIQICFNNNEHINNSNIRGQVSSFEEWVAVCLYYIKIAGRNNGSRVTDCFIANTHKTSIDVEEKKLQFYNDCIEPILIFIELQIKQSHNAIRILERYKILCEWYERDSILPEKELSLTQNHLSKYLFNQGFTYSLAETNVPDGRIDNLALSLGKTSAAELGNLPDVIVAEGKIFKDKPKVITEVMNQTNKRIEHLNLPEGYCVIFNKSEKNINITDADGRLSGIPYIITGTKRIFFIIINLNELFFESTTSIEVLDIKLKP